MRLMFEAGEKMKNEGIKLCLKAVNIGEGGDKGIYSCRCTACHTTVNQAKLNEIWNLSKDPQKIRNVKTSVSLTSSKKS